MEITARLMAVASFVREGAYLCDVGTDHAYLPIYLAENGRIRACLASDIHEGPCESARAHIAANGFADIIKVKRADGLSGFTPCGKTDIVIAGMGGALICEILEKAEGIKTGDVRLILQPMRNVPDLRAYLYENGFDITGEKLAREEERIYEIICAEYSGKKRTASKLSLLLGEKNIENKAQDKALFSAFCEKQAAALEKKIAGMRTGGADTGAEEELLRECRMQNAECRMQSAECRVLNEK
ncbi:MAG: SAM-dependent methyltransferase [Clostridia bacterium]|nr:SAM-dependent methyltransferase [Clostridia bacterium]